MLLRRWRRPRLPDFSLFQSYFREQRDCIKGGNGTLAACRIGFHIDVDGGEVEYAGGYCTRVELTSSKLRDGKVENGIWVGWLGLEVWKGFFDLFCEYCDCFEGYWSVCIRLFPNVAMLSNHISRISLAYNLQGKSRSSSYLSRFPAYNCLWHISFASTCQIHILVHDDYSDEKFLCHG